MEENKQEEQVNEMPEQEVQEEQSISIPKSMLKTAIGIMFIFIGLLAVIGWWNELITVIKGCIGVLLIFAGAIAIAIAKE